MSVQAARAPPLGFFTKALYGFGSIAYGVKDAAFRAYLLFYYNLIVGIPAGLVSVAITLALVIDTIADPVIGQFSDTLRTKIGRRHPLMYASAIPVALSFLLLWTPPAGLNAIEICIYLCVVSVLVRTLITLYEIPSSSLAPELTEKYDERTAIASYRFFFGYLGAFGISILMLSVFMHPTRAYPVGQLNPEAYWKFAIAGAVIILASILISAWGTHHRIKYFKPLAAPKRLGLFKTIALMGSTYAHRDFLAVLAFGTLKYTAVGVSGALVLYFGTYFWEFSSKQMALLSFEAIAAAMVSMAVAPAASRWLGKRQAAVIFSVLAPLIASVPYVLRFNDMFFENGDPRLLWTIFGIQACYTLCGISAAIIVHAMIGDVVDSSALKTGRRAEGLFYSANSLMQKCVSGLGILVAGIILTEAHFPTGAKPGKVDQQILDNLALFYLPAIAAFYIVGAAFLYFYRIDRASHEANLARLREREAGAASLGD